MIKKKINIENTVRKLRFNNDEMTQQQLAELVGISRQTVVAIEKYKYTPSLDLSLIHISEPTRPERIAYAVLWL